jgi:acyl-homoserine-lactone acylase
MAKKEFTVYRTHHGPVVREAQGKWVAVRLMNQPLKALQQSYLRTKTHNLAEFKKVMDLHTDSSNNTVFADAEGNIAYFHANFIPKRNPKFDWSQAVDGSDPATEWGPVMSVDESPNSINPANGWIQNTNNWPYSVSGPFSPKQKDYPAYVDTGTENPRGVHAQLMLDGRRGFTKDSLIAAAFDSYLPELAVQLPLLFKDYDALDSASPLKAKLAEPVKLLRAWDFRWGANSVATSVAVFWGEEVWQRLEADALKAKLSVYDFLRTRATAQQRLDSLAAAVDKLAADFGRWDTPWGEINRFQRLTGDIAQPFNDAGASIPVAFPSERWGSLAAFEAHAYPGTKKWYGTSGNSFVAVVEFGDTVSARAVTAGGLNSVPSSKHFNDQAGRYAAGTMREVYFYPKQLEGHTERRYSPGEK